jgi:hypothetical protein
MEGKDVSQESRRLSSLLSLWICRASQERLSWNNDIVGGRIFVRHYVGENI